MKPSGAIAVFLVISVQILLFMFIWEALNTAASEMNRPQSGGVNFGITIHYGTIILGAAFFIASVISAATRKKIIRWSTIGVLLISWSAWVAQSFPSHPIRCSAFISLGAFILIVGSGVLLPILSCALEHKIHR